MHNNSNDIIIAVHYHIDHFLQGQGESINPFSNIILFVKTHSWFNLSIQPLVRACRYGRTKIVKLLFDKGVERDPQAMVEAIKGGFR